jgi:hypothetical protein
MTKSALLVYSSHSDLAFAVIDLSRAFLSIELGFLSSYVPYYEDQKDISSILASHLQTHIQLYYPHDLLNTLNNNPLLSPLVFIPSTNVFFPYESIVVLTSHLEAIGLEPLIFAVQ